MVVLPGGLLSNLHGLAASRMIICPLEGERLGVLESGDQNRKSQKPADDSAGFWLLVGGKRLPMANPNPGPWIEVGFRQPRSGGTLLAAAVAAGLGARLAAAIAVA